jgi:hypothetical protein
MVLSQRLEYIATRELISIVGHIDQWITCEHRQKLARLSFSIVVNSEHRIVDTLFRLLSVFGLLFRILSSFVGVEVTSYPTNEISRRVFIAISVMRSEVLLVHSAFSEHCTC